MKSLIAALPVVLALVIAGCSGAAVAPSASPSPGPSSPGPSSAAPGGSEPGSIGPVGPSPDDGAIGGGDPEPGQPALVLPKPGQLDVHDVAIEQLSAKVAERHVVVNARWWSGVEPCHVLDSVAAKRDGQTITVSVREGTSNRDAMCIEIAMLKITAIDLGDLEPGEYTIAASQGPAAAITIKVS